MKITLKVQLPKLRAPDETETVSDHVVTPPGLSECREMCEAWAEASGRMPILRVAAAIIGLSTRLGPAAMCPLSAYTSRGCDVYGYGGRVYEWLAGRGATDAELLPAAQRVYDEVLARRAFPSLAEVAVAEGFTDPPEGS